MHWKFLTLHVMKAKIAMLMCMVLSLACSAQTKPGIGLTQTPSDQDQICSIKTYLGGFDQSGYKTGDTIPDFKLYNLNNQATTLSTELGKGLPVLLIAGSYTCPVFRNQMASINKITADYNGKVKVFIIYVVEAHPVTDVSPYSGKEWLTGQNQQENILIRQPTTYGERKTVVQEMLKDLTIAPEILIDGPCNAWWNHFGPAPNNAYIIQTNGVVFAKHGWYDKAPNNITCDLDKVIGKTCNVNSNTGGTFKWKLDSTSSVFGGADEILTVKGKLINESSASADIQVIRMQNNLPGGWASAMCVDICLPDWVDTTELILASGDTQSYTLYFYTGVGGNETGHVRIGFRNKAVSSNKVAQDFYGYTRVAGTSHLPNPVDKPYPNPFQETFTIKTETGEQIEVYDAMGRLVLQMDGQNGLTTVSMRTFDSGIYLVTRLINSNRQVSTVIKW